METSHFLFYQGATIVDQPICIARWGHHDEVSDSWDGPYWKLEDGNVSTVCILELLILVV